MAKKIKLGIIGFGNMGTALAEQLKGECELYVFDRDRAKTSGKTEINVARSLNALVKTVDVVILAVKPQDFQNLLDEIKARIAGKLAISIAAGIPTAFIEKQLPKTRLMRVMPNLPAKIGKGMICVCRGKSADEGDLNITQQLFKNLGEVLFLNEEMIDAATAISGSGPGYLYDWAQKKTIEEIEKYIRNTFIPSLTAAARELKFSPDQAEILARVTAEGSLAYLKNIGISPSELKKQVASKGGTTEAALEVLHRGGTLAEAVKAAYKRAKELSRR